MCVRIAVSFSALRWRVDVGSRLGDRYAGLARVAQGADGAKDAVQCLRSPVGQEGEEKEYESWGRWCARWDDTEGGWHVKVVWDKTLRVRVTTA